MKKHKQSFFTHVDLNHTSPYFKEIKKKTSCVIQREHCSHN